MSFLRTSASMITACVCALALTTAPALASGGSGGGGGSTTSSSSSAATPCVSVTGQSGSVIRYGGIDYLRFFATIHSCSSSTQYVYLRMTDLSTSIFDTNFVINGSSTLLPGATLQGSTDGGGFTAATPTSWTIRTEVHDLQSGALLSTYTSTVSVAPRNRNGIT